MAEETSPYLRQHADNPVDWYPWGSEAFAAARSEDKPILLSVGYSACHWCHVMAHESFEDPEIAAVMNRLFVNVKVDREERPDVDALYMEVVQALTGHGGWPMTVFMTPEGKPFFGGTYFPKAPRGGMTSFPELCQRIDEVWRTRRDDLTAQAVELTGALGRTSRLTPADDLPDAGATLDEALQSLLAQHDATWGGFGGAPKFPQAMSLEVLVRAVARNGPAANDARAALETSLDAMASGGMYDHLGGGFARYSVDNVWLVPHFEKMLYDQALLARVYLHAWQATGLDRYRQVLDETIGYVLRELRHDEGGFFSAEDADSEGEEGRFYVWSPDDIRSVLSGSDDTLADRVVEFYGVTAEGNFEDSGRSILNRIHARGDLARPDDVEAARAQLFDARELRVRPGLDDKVLTEWNGLMLATLAEAAAATGRDDWRAAAVRNGEFLLERLRREDGRWLRSWQADGGARHLAYAADYGALLDGFVRLAEATGEARWIEAARDTAGGLLDLFWDDENGGAFTTGSDAEQLVASTKDLMDNATPSANSLAAVGLLRLAALTGEDRFREAAETALRLTGPLVSQHPTAFGHLLIALDLVAHGVDEVVIPGDDRADLVEAVQRAYVPNAVLAWGEAYDSPLWEGREDGQAYVCRDFACQLPSTDVEGLLAQLAVK